MTKWASLSRSCVSLTWLLFLTCGGKIPWCCSNWAFSIFHPSELPQSPCAELPPSFREKVQVLTIHYSPLKLLTRECGYQTLVNCSFCSISSHPQKVVSILIITSLNSLLRMSSNPSLEKLACIGVVLPLIFYNRMWMGVSASARIKICYTIGLVPVS